MLTHDLIRFFLDAINLVGNENDSNIREKKMKEKKKQDLKFHSIKK